MYYFWLLTFKLEGLQYFAFEVYSRIIFETKEYYNGNLSFAMQPFSFVIPNF